MDSKYQQDNKSTDSNGQVQQGKKQTDAGQLVSAR